MDYEKKYKEAINRAKAMVKVANSQEEIYNSVITIFPELKESEDKMIREYLIRYIDNTMKSSELKSKLLAWLEKQGEQKPTLPKWKYKKDNTTLLKDSLVLNKCGHMAKLSSGAIVSDVWVLDYNELAKLPKEELEEQSEQNPTDNVEPKFKVGDTIKKESTGDIVTISEIDLKNREYRLSNTGFIPFKYEHLWELVEQKPAWSEEDERILDALITSLINERFAGRLEFLKGIKVSLVIDWLKTLKEKIKKEAV